MKDKFIPSNVEGLYFNIVPCVYKYDKSMKFDAYRCYIKNLSEADRYKEIK